jgi:hypothetical protein
MRLVRKIQLSAALVVASGFGIAGTAPQVALAASCGPIQLCWTRPVCITGTFTTNCMNDTPPGCTFTSVSCPVGTCFGGSGWEYQCNYTAS